MKHPYVINNASDDQLTAQPTEQKVRILVQKRGPAGVGVRNLSVDPDYRRKKVTHTHTHTQGHWTW